MPSLTKTLVCLAATCNGFLAPAPQRPATVLQAATIAAKDVSALRKASGPDPVQEMQENGAFKLVARAARTRAALQPCVARRHRRDRAATTQQKNAGAGMMDCKKALVEADGDVEKASEWLRVKGLASAAKKGERATKEGLIETYVHTGGKLGVMVEVNCETDFVSKGDKFKELCKMLAMQIAACPGVEYVKAEDISEEARAKERALEMKSEDLEGKPEAIKEKMVEGRVNKMFKEKILLDQKYIKDDSMTVADFVASYVAVLGENIQVARFGTFRLGETQDA